ncbi:MAG: AbrB/MazE/SpoVT family DNA-binding domain-containing protein [Patescibacteria group bacterium]
MPSNITQTQKYIVSVNKMRRGALTIPAEIREEADWRDGHFFEIVFDKKTKRIYVQPQNLMNEIEFVELSKTGEKMVKEALDEVKQGKIKGPYNDVAGLLKDLKK